jgi:hypothetical protein
MIKDIVNNRQILLGTILCLAILVALLVYRINTSTIATGTSAVQSIIQGPQTEETVAIANQPTTKDAKASIDIGRRTVTIYDCGLLDDFEVMHRGVSVFKDNAQKLFNASQLRQLNQKNTFRLDRINGDCKVKLGPIFNSPIAAN